MTGDEEQQVHAADLCRRLLVGVTLFVLGAMRGAPGLATEASDLRTLEATRQRPLFSPTRRPPPPSVVDEAEAPPAPPVKPPPDIKVSGIILGSERSVAIVRLGQNAASLHVSLGSQVDGWTVSAIEARRIELRLGSRSLTAVLPDPGH